MKCEMCNVFVKDIEKHNQKVHPKILSKDDWEMKREKEFREREVKRLYNMNDRKSIFIDDFEERVKSKEFQRVLENLENKELVNWFKNSIEKKEKMSGRGIDYYAWTLIADFYLQQIYTMVENINSLDDKVLKKRVLDGFKKELKFWREDFKDAKDTIKKLPHELIEQLSEIPRGMVEEVDDIKHAIATEEYFNECYEVTKRIIEILKPLSSKELFEKINEFLNREKIEVKP